MTAQSRWIRAALVLVAGLLSLPLFALALGLFVRFLPDANTLLWVRLSVVGLLLFLVPAAALWLTDRVSRRLLRTS